MSDINEKPVQTEEVAEKNTESKKEKSKKSMKQEIISWILTLGAAVVIALVIRTFLFEFIRVDGESMMNTLTDKEIVLMTKPAYLAGKMERGDVVICNYPDRGRTLFVKRLIALPGDSIEIINGVVYVNDELVNEDDIDKMSDGTHFRANYPRRVLGEDEYFVMGDNRDHSNDSRTVGPLSRSMIRGHVQRVILPLTKFGQKVK